MSEAPGDSTGSLVSININLSGLANVAEHAGKCYNNSLKAISFGTSAVWNTFKPLIDAKIKKSAAITEAQTAIDLKKIAPPSELFISSAKTEDAATTYLLNQATRQQTNREAIIEDFVSEIATNPPLTDAVSDIDEDWLAQFWGFCEKVGKRNVQTFYAKLLASEVKTPGSISPLTLQTLSVLSPEAALIFQRFCSLSIDDGERVFVIHPHAHAFLNYGPLEQYGISRQDLAEITSYGFIISDQTATIQYAEDNIPMPINYGGHYAVFNFSKVQTNELVFTRRGAELRRIIPFEPNPIFTATLLDKFKGAFSYTPPSG